MSVIPQPPRSTIRHAVAIGMELTLRVLETDTSGNLKEQAISVIANADGLIESRETGVLIHTTHARFTETASGHDCRVLEWNTPDGSLLLRVFMGPSGEVIAHRSRIPELLGLEAGTYVLRDIQAI